MRVLVCDDSRAVHAMLKSMLEGTAIELIHAHHPAECVRLLSQETAYGALLLDWEMPDVNGIKLLRLLRNSGFTLPIIMLTGKNSSAAIDEAIRLGAYGYIMKPFTRNLVLEALPSLES